MENRDSLTESEEIMRENSMKEPEPKRTIPQIILGSAIWTCILGFLLTSLGQTIGLIPLVFLDQDSDFAQTAGMYFMFAGVWIALFLNALLPKNRPLFKAYGTGLRGNNVKDLLIGYLIGFGMNGAAILMAMLHGDIHLYFERFEFVPFLILIVAVFIQSAAEELVCRGFVYQRVLRTYRGKYWLAILLNSLLFAVMHLGNEGVTLLALVDIAITGILFSMMVYYFDSLWMAMAAHAGWNFTQSILVGLPNSGIVLPYSVFRLDAATARNSFFYDTGFGVEGTIPAILIQVAVTAAIIVIGRKIGQKPTDIWAGEDA